MTYFIEEEKKQVNIIFLILVIFLLIVFFVGGYYLFFTKPELLDVVAPSQLRMVNELTKANFDVEEVINSPAFRSLKNYYTSQSLTTSTIGRENPFLPF